MFDKAAFPLIVACVLPLGISRGAARGQDIAYPPPPGPGPCYAAPFGPVVTTPVRMTPSCNCRGRRHKAWCQAKFVGYPEEFNEWPHGWSLYANNNTQVANGVAARMTFYHFDFEEGGSRLNTQGMDKLARVTAVLPSSFAPVVVERTPGNDALDQSRRLALVNAFGSGSFPVPPERVIVGKPIANGLVNGYEAEYITTNLYRQTQSQGNPNLGAPTGGSGLTGAGLTGGVTSGAAGR